MMRETQQFEAGKVFALVTTTKREGERLVSM